MNDLQSRQVAFIDDDDELRRATAQSLRLAGLTPQPFANAESALAAINRSFEGVVVTDIRMPGMDGLELFRRLNEMDEDLPVILITGHADVPTAVTAMRNGAYDFLSKPYPPDNLIASVQRALEKRSLVFENRRLRQMRDESRQMPLFGHTPAIERLRKTISQIATIEMDVLVEGETGTGKGVIATMLHEQSARKTRPMVTIDCGALPESFADSELFGHVGGAFPGAQQARTGRIEQATRGTLFFDDIQMMRDDIQQKIRRVLETRAVFPLGSNISRPVDLRVIAATRMDLAARVQEGTFSAALYYRINGITLTVPPLRERREDIPPLFDIFLSRAAERQQRETPKLTPSVWRRLKNHDWPGNVRELMTYAEHVALGIDAPPSGATTAKVPYSGALKDRVGQYEAALIEEALEASSGDVAATLLLLDIPRKTFYDKVSRHSIELSRFKKRRV
jgi:two-component system, NtrC family, C4-dicarboxylate transport response regulator DctD